MVGAVGMTDTPDLLRRGAELGVHRHQPRRPGPGRLRRAGPGRGHPRSRRKQRAHSLLEANRHLVEALRDALLERHELIGSEITDILEAARRRGPAPVAIDLRDHAPATEA